MKSTTKTLTEGPLAKQILLVSLPLALSNLLQVLFNMSDVAVVGRFAGSTALAPGLHQHSGHPVHRLSHRPEQRHQRAGGTLLRGPAHRRCAKDGALGRHRQPDRRCGAAVHRPAGFALHAAAAQHQGTTCCLVPSLYLRVYFLGMPALALYNFGNAVFSSIGDNQKPPDLSVPLRAR